jgi:hypothetical protein
MRDLSVDTAFVEFARLQTNAMVFEGILHPTQTIAIARKRADTEPLQLRKNDGDSCRTSCS